MKRCRGALSKSLGLLFDRDRNLDAVGYLPGRQVSCLLLFLSETAHIETRETGWGGVDILIAFHTSHNALGQVQEKKEASRHAGLVLIRHHSWPCLNVRLRGEFSLLAGEGVGALYVKRPGGGRGVREGGTGEVASTCIISLPYHVLVSIIRMRANENMRKAIN